MSHISLENISQFLYREARFLDDEQWDDWLACYAPSVEFWMPAWDDNDKLVENPKTDISLIYYGSRQGLEDRIFRIKTERSSATMPDTRTCHSVNNIEVVSQDGENVTVRFNWHTLSHRYKTDYSYFGMSRYVIDFSGEHPKILNKYVILKNDYIHQVIDIYHI